MESSRNSGGRAVLACRIIKGGQNGVKSQLGMEFVMPQPDYKGGAKWSQVATIFLVVIRYRLL